MLELVPTLCQKKKKKEVEDHVHDMLSLLSIDHVVCAFCYKVIQIIN